MLFRFPESKVTEEVWDSLETKYIKSIIYYIIDSKFRQSVKLSSWLEYQVNNPGGNTILLASQIDDADNTDEQMLNILRFVRDYLTYRSDTDIWDMPEKWQEGDVTAQLSTGDCEDGAILMYLIARYKGVPANRLLLFCGDVNGGGHCWLGYKPNAYPLDWAFIDWCYFVNLNSIEYRNKFNIIDNTIYEYNYDNELTSIDSNYYNIWFGVNEIYSYKVITYDF